MAIDIANETLITLAEASQRLPNRPSVTTMWRWWQHGIRGHKLETTPIGAKRFTSVEALQRFTDRLNGSESTAATRAPTPKQAERATESRLKEADRRLAAAGISLPPRKRAAASA